MAGPDPDLPDPTHTRWGTPDTLKTQRDGRRMRRS